MTKRDLQRLQKAKAKVAELEEEFKLLPFWRHHEAQWILYEARCKANSILAPYIEAVYDEYNMKEEEALDKHKAIIADLRGARKNAIDALAELGCP